MPSQLPRVGEFRARDLREQLEIAESDAVKDIVAVIETIGVPVFLTPLPAGISGLASRLNGRWYMVADSAGPSAGRLRFTLAHELGHVFMGHEPSVDDHSTLIMREGGNQQEVEANYFAAEFLMPRNAVEDAFLAAELPSDEADAQIAFLLEMASRFGTTAFVPLYRLKTLGFLDGRDVTVIEEHLSQQAGTEGDWSDLTAQFAGSGKTRMPAAHEERLKLIEQLNAEDTEA